MDMNANANSRDDWHMTCSASGCGLKTAPGKTGEQPTILTAEEERVMDVATASTLGHPISLTTAVQTTSTSKSIDEVKNVTKDEFLQLLVAQLRNQDPLEPVKNEAFLAQLATFSSLEQLISIKDGVNKLVESISNETAGTMSTQS